MSTFAVPPAEDDGVRRQRDLERQQQEQAAARSLEATSIGEGGLTVQDGGAIRIEDGGDLFVDGDAVFNGSLTVPAGSLNTAGSISAGDDVTAGNDVTAGGMVRGSIVEATDAVKAGGNVNADVDITSGGAVVVGGALRAMSVYSTIGTSDYRAVWVTGVDGQLLYVPSSARFKQDIEPTVVDPAVVLALQLVTFRYIQAVEQMGEDAAVEIGLIAEEVHALGLRWLVDYDDDGLPFGVKFEKLALALLSVAQDHERRIAALESAQN